MKVNEKSLTEPKILNEFLNHKLKFFLNISVAAKHGLNLVAKTKTKSDYDVTLTQYVIWDVQREIFTTLHQR